MPPAPIMTTIFVFGSNLAGRHGAGSAKEAVKNWGAIYGQGIGRQGNSYAIPTKDEKLKVLPLDVIHGHIADFLCYAEVNPRLQFEIVDIGCGLAGYDVEDIADLFIDVPDNCKFLGKLHAILD